VRSIHFDPDAWEDFLYWLGADRKMATRIARLIGEIQRDPFSGIGKPEPLKGDLSGYWSRRIDDEHRMVYRADDREVKILKARYHYSDWAIPDGFGPARRPCTPIVLSWC
jgi:toxin YoeB